jgi:hypothetical protein
MAIGLGLVVVPLWARAESGARLPPWVSTLSPLGGVVLAIGSGTLLALPRRKAGVLALSLASLLLIVIVHIGPVRVAAPAYDVRPAAARIREWQAEGRPIAHAGRYHGQFQFPGRLRRPVERIDPQQGRAWLRAHPTGKLIEYHRDWPVDVPSAPDFAQPYRGRTLAIWGRDSVEGARKWPLASLPTDRTARHIVKATPRPSSLATVRRP